jgi:hypothetical protein
MPLKVFTIPAQDDGPAADAVNQFANSVRVVTLEKRFVEDGQNSFWAICITYLASAATRPTAPKREKADYREILPDSEFAVYAKLRSLRKQLAEREGVPAYALFTNEQMAAMVQGRVSTREALKALPGVGDARIDKYADAFLDLLRPEIAAIADWDNLAAAFHAAARGKRVGPAVCAFEAGLERELVDMRSAILDGSIRPEPMESFWIRDPKRRLIHAPGFRDRVLHHAIMARVGPVLEQSLVFDAYACRKGKGALAAVRRCQQHARRFPIYVKSDIRAYFASIDHAVLCGQLARRLKDRGVLALLGRIVAAYETAPARGLPIGALTSQHFANLYLTDLDRFLLETLKVRGMTRYMDDVIWWRDDVESARADLAAVRAFAGERLRLQIKPSVQIGRAEEGVMFCGFRVRPGSLGLSRRRRERYAAGRRRWEAAWLAGRIDAAGLQAGYAATLAITAHSDAAAWRRGQLARRPVAGALAEV